MRVAIVIIRTLIVYFALVLFMRLMGKRQLGELELPELAVAVLIADLAAHPLQDIGIPLMNGLLPVAVLFCCEVLISGADTSYLIPKHPDYVDHIRYFVGNHITRVKRAQDIPEDILKVSAYCRDGAASHAQTLGAPWKAAYSVAVAGEKWLDFTRADKGTGLAALCGELGVRPQEVIAFGDNFNDVPMLDLVGSPYIMQGAVPALLERYPMQCARVEDVLRKLAEG